MTKASFEITTDNKKKFIASRRKRNLAICFGLLAFIVTIYFVTLFKLGSQLFI